MKKFCLLMALIMCLGCVFFTACKNDETDSPEDSIDDTTEIITDTDGGDESESDTEPAETTERVIDDKNDAVADDIYENVGPEIYG